MLDPLLLGQNLHLVHHLWPRVPFYRYRAAFEASREYLDTKGATVNRPFGGVNGGSRTGGEPSAGA